MVSTRVKAFVVSLAAARVVVGDRPESGQDEDQDQQIEQEILKRGLGEYAAGQKGAIEMTRLISAFSLGFEFMVDQTPKLPFLTSLLQSGEDATAYAFLDTWVGKNTGWEVTRTFKPDTNSQRCVLSEQKVSETPGNGNGLGLKTSLLFFPKEGDTSVAPSYAATLSPGPLGGEYRFGNVEIHEGVMADGGKSVLLQTATNLDATTDQDLHVYPCQKGGKSLLEQGHEYNQRVRDLDRAASRNDPREMERVVEEVRSSLLRKSLRDVTVLKVKDKHIEFEYTDEMQLKVGMPVFLHDPDPTSVMQVNASNNEVGSITAIDKKSKTVSAQVECKCWLTEEMKQDIQNLHLKVPVKSGWEDEAEKASLAFQRYGNTRMHGSGTSLLDDASSAKILSFTVVNAEGDLTQLLSVGKVIIPAVTDGRTEAQPSRGAGGTPAASLLSSGHTLSDGSQVCLVDERHTGKLFDRHVHIPAVPHGGKVILEVSHTGHHWERTHESCGEFCKLRHYLKINGHDTPRIESYHSCASNPNGPQQAGTWAGPRASWCPGAPAAPSFLDVTDHVKPGMNNVQLHLEVLNENTGVFEPYTDMDGYNNNDFATDIVSSYIYLYGKDAVDSILKQQEPLTPAEAALRAHAGTVIGPWQGSKSFLQVAEEKSPADLHSSLVLTKEEFELNKKRALEHGNRTQFGNISSSSLVSVSSSNVDLHSSCKNPVEPAAWNLPGGAAAPFNFNKASPWFCYNSNVKLPDGVVEVPLFRDETMSIDNRLATSTVNGASLLQGQKYSRVALHVQLKSPKPYEGVRPDGTPYPHAYDAYDRVGSIGFLKHGHTFLQNFEADPEQSKLSLMPEAVNYDKYGHYRDVLATVQKHNQVATE